MDQGKRFLISGASGLIGNALVRAWKDQQIGVVRLVRNKTEGPQGDSQEPQGDGQDMSVPWNPTASAPFPDPERLGRIDAAVHLSGANVAAHRWTKAYKHEIVNSRVQSTEALCNLIARLTPRPQLLVCASAIGIYGDRGDTPLTEVSTPGTGFLADTCIAWEAATHAAESAGIRVAHMRFGVVLSTRGGALGKLLPLFRIGAGGRLGSGRQWMPWVTLRDTIGAIQHTLRSPAISGPVNVVSPGPVTNAVFAHTLGAVLHRPAILPAPAFALRLAVGEMADQALLASARVLPAKLIESGYRFADPDLAPAIEGLLTK